MAYENIVGLSVTDDVSYAAYRTGMIPILQKYGGKFRYDFKIAEILINEAGKKINRLFVISFESQARKEAFFADTDYLSVRKKFFEQAVEDITTIAQYNLP